MLNNPGEVIVAVFIEQPLAWKLQMWPAAPPSSPAGSHAAFAVSLQKLQQELEFLEVQEEYIKDEQKNLKKEFLHAQEEVKRIQSIPLVIGQFLEAVDQNTAIVGSTTGTVGEKRQTLIDLLNQKKGFSISINGILHHLEISNNCFCYLSASPLTWLCDK